MSNEKIILYQTEDGSTKVQLPVSEGTVWLTQDEIASLYDIARSTVSGHLRNIYAENELNENLTTENLQRLATDGKEYSYKHYNLDAILAVGYRVNSPRGMHFRRWATTILKEYLIKGFAMDDDRLKQSDNYDYFDELLERIRDIRASEKRFYQKIRDIYTTAIDYDKDSNQAKDFFAKVQNKMLWAVTGKTAPEIVKARSNPKKPNMGLTTWSGRRIKKGDVTISKNYLAEEEISQLNRIVTMYLDYAENQAIQREAVTMVQWSEKLDAFLEFNEMEILTHAGSVEAVVAKELAEKHYEEFDANRKTFEASEADGEDLKEIEEIERSLSEKPKNENEAQ